MTTLEIAQKYGVPTPETCMELDYQKETHFSWTGLNNLDLGTDYYLSVFFGEKGKVLETEKWYSRDKEATVRIVKAPQSHEIALLFEKKEGFAGVEIIGNYVCYLRWKQQIQNHHYAEAYAQLYLKLKNENLL